MAFASSLSRSCAILGLQLMLAACVRNPPLAPGKVESPRAPASTVPAPPPSPPLAAYACKTPGAAVPGDDVGRICVPYAGTPKGDAQALVTLVMFTDFQCPFCGRVTSTLQKLAERYPGQIRLYLRHNPLPFHTNARLAAQAAVAAEKQGKLWAMYDLLFAHQMALERENLARYAQELGLDLERFKSDMDSSETQKRVADDLELGTTVGVQGTPIFFINGRAIRGAVPLENFTAVIDDELQRARQMGAKAATGYSFYAALMNGEGKGLGKPQGPTPPPAIPVDTEVLKIAVGNEPQRGGKQPKITLVAFLDFQCPYSGRVKKTLDSLLDRYPDDLRVVFHHYPLPFHDRAMAAALAAAGAEQQDKFWEMVELLMANQTALTAQDLEKYAGMLGLDLARYRAVVADPKTKARVEEDIKLGNRFGVAGTPTFFMNGRRFAGAYPLDSFVKLFDEEIKRVDALLASGAPRADLYATMTKKGLDRASPKKETPRPGEPRPDEVYRADIQGAPTKGAKNALVTIVEYADFQCPFCQRVEATLAQVMTEYHGKVRLVWRNLPLAFHDRAMSAAVAAMAAGRQGKFWEMHDLLFANQTNLDAKAIESYAEKIGLDMVKFRAALQDTAIAKAIDGEGRAAAKIGARGTPAFFINGTFLSGAQPFERFKERIDEQLAKANALVKKGTPKSKVYDAIMKHAKAEVEGASATGAGSDEKGRQEVAAGNAPSRGPENARITLVVFSDLQCPFCLRLEATLAELESAFPGKIRVVWKNFPMSFHPRGKPCAEAAMAAHEQGKFWAMQKLIFKNQGDLAEWNLEDYAREAGLDMARYKAAMAGHKFAAAVEADIKQGTSLGIQGTPATFVNGRLISGAQPFEVFKAAIERELSKTADSKR